MALRSLIFNQQILHNSVPILSQFLQQNGMSQFPSYYIKPIYQKEAQDELVKNNEAQNYAHLPVRPALVDQTCSLTHDPKISLFINYVMRGGNKALARQLVEKAFEMVKRKQLEKYHKAKEEDKHKIDIDPKEIFHKAIGNVRPILQLTPIKRGGVRYQVPVPITERRAQYLSMRWIIDAAKEKERTLHFPETLANELVAAATNGGKAVKKKQDLHKQCEANRAYAHYRWS
ncbi:ribosomal protein s7 [Holotrichia oblita]|uniref:Ribosomal protein s7 n=1 Tax=Holotrichia oblita TaxID=644536 RepID=A0ACB9SNB9_HOLOL|nr:ribosomal protein s7 [Holotrichia oblita]